MAVTSMTYANRLIYTDIYNEKAQGMMEYNDDMVPTINITDAVQFACHVNADYEDKLLYTFADGKKLVMNYHIYQDGNYYYMKHKYKLLDASGNLVTFPTGAAYSFNNPSVEYTSSQPWDPTQPGFDTFPFSEMYYVPSFVNYNQSGEETIVGDPALNVEPFGKVFWKVTRPPVGGYKEFYGTNARDQHTNSYNNASTSIVGITSEAGYTQFFEFADPTGSWHESGEKTPDPDPSGPGGGDRPSDDGGEQVDFPGLPTTSVINTGLISLYTPDNTQLRSLAGVLWGNDFEQSIKKVLNDPFDGLIGLSMVPFSPTTSGSVSCEIGNFDTEVTMPLVNAQYYTLDCGTVTVQENWKNALDYNATTCEIFVPFVGFRPLDIQDVMGRTLALKYNVDILSGAAIAILKCGDKCLYEWPCNLSYDIPLTGSNKSALYTGLISVAMSGLGGLVAGGAMGAVGGAATSAINVATHAQSNVQRGGSLASNTGVLGEFLPYIVLHRPKQSLAKNFKTFKGYQSNITSVLGNCQGYTEIDFIHLTGISGATDTELQEIEQLLKSGVII